MFGAMLRVTLPWLLIFFHTQLPEFLLSCLGTNKIRHPLLQIQISAGQPPPKIHNFRFLLQHYPPVLSRHLSIPHRDKNSLQETHRKEPKASLSSANPKPWPNLAQKARGWSGEWKGRWVKTRWASLVSLHPSGALWAFMPLSLLFWFWLHFQQLIFSPGHIT